MNQSDNQLAKIKYRAFKDGDITSFLGPLPMSQLAISFFWNFTSFHVVNFHPLAISNTSYPSDF
tara:strand:- start:152 stop:343 length:192 start_codon:yes stop_codon:yes gene_type:complete